MMIALRNREMKLVMINESKVPAPATPASVCTASGMTEQLVVALDIVTERFTVPEFERLRGSSMDA